MTSPVNSYSVSIAVSNENPDGSGWSKHVYHSEPTRYPVKAIRILDAGTGDVFLISVKRVRARKPGAT